MKDQNAVKKCNHAHKDTHKGRRVLVVGVSQDSVTPASVAKKAAGADIVFFQILKESQKEITEVTC